MIGNGVFTFALKIGVFFRVIAHLCLHVQRSANTRLNAGMNEYENQLLRHVKTSILRCIHTQLRLTEIYTEKVTADVNYA